jgi:hypothetical protein
MKGAHLNSREAATAINLLGKYQGLLESAIDCHTSPDGEPAPCDRAVVEDARRHWNKAERLVKEIDRRRRRRP